MSAQKTAILTFCNAKLLREDTVAGILDEIQQVLDDLSKMGKWPDLYRANVEADRKTLASGTSSSALPDGLRVLDYIIINDGDKDGKPLKNGSRTPPIRRSSITGATIRSSKRQRRGMMRTFCSVTNTTG